MLVTPFRTSIFRPILEPRLSSSSLTMVSLVDFLKYSTKQFQYKGILLKPLLELKYIVSTQKVFCGHEYTNSNLKFATHVDPSNKAILSKLEWSEKMKTERQPTVPSTIGEEKETNPFMRVETESLQERSASKDPVQTMAHIRKEKDNFKG